MRLFIALNFDGREREAICHVQQQLKARCTTGSFTRPENLHLTLAFLGEISPDRIPVLREILRKISAASFSMVFDRLGFFPGKGPETLWYLQGQIPPELYGLVKQLHRELRRQGFSLEDREFLPHVTLGRRCITEGAPEILPVTAEFHSMELMLSERINGVLTYTPIFSKTFKTPRT